MTVGQEIAAPLDAPVPEPRAFQEAAGRWLEFVTATARQAGVSTIRLDSCSLDALEALRSLFILRGGTMFREAASAARLQAGAPGSLPRPLPSSPLRSWLWRWRHRLHRVSLRPAETGPTLLLAIPRTAPHVYDIVPVDRALRERGASTRFVAFQALAGVIQRLGGQPIDLSSRGAVGDVLRVPGRRRRLLEAAATAASSFLDPLGSKETASRLTRAVLEEGLLDAVWFAGRFEEAIRRCKPRVVMVGNPFTLEGRVAAMVARELGVPVSCVEHGTIFPNDPFWYHCPVDRVYVWGTPSRDALLSNGIPSERIVVAGAPRLDSFAKPAGGEKRSILVATSGAGDQVSLERHVAFIGILVEAASLLPEVPWIVKLHPKDDRRLYEEPLRKRGLTNVSIRDGAPDLKGVDIYGFLAESKALVTVVSTSALDALACGVPVVAVVPRGGDDYRHVDFLRRGAATCVSTAAGLADAVRGALEGRLDPAVERAAAELVAEQFVNRGRAASVIAADLLRLADGRPRVL